jgi:hypothetical protein
MVFSAVLVIGKLWTVNNVYIDSWHHLSVTPNIIYFLRPVPIPFLVHIAFRAICSISTIDSGIMKETINHLVPL